MPMPIDAMPGFDNENRENLRTELLHIIRNQTIKSVYQPIVSLSEGIVMGYEALTRGPEHSALHSPISLFAAAKAEGLLYPLDRLARAKAIEGAFTKTKEQLLFLNVSAEILNDPDFVPGRTLELLEKRGLSPGQVVFEITERSSIEDFESAKQILGHYRQQGYRIAIDDAGAGYSSLQAIAELQPDFIKMDRSLVHNLHFNKTKEYILETMLTFAQKLGIYLIAEGIETREELMKLTRMGVHYGQGYLLGHPGPEEAVLPPELTDHIMMHRKIVEASSVWTIGDICVPCQTFDYRDPISIVANYFKNHTDAAGAVIVNGQTPVGLIMRDRLFQQLAGQYGYSLFWNRPIDQLMDAQPLIVDEQAPVEQVSQYTTSRDLQTFYDLVIITSGGRVKGTASIRSILECITTAKMERAKVANPLTGLPGNMQIHREINKRLLDHKKFSVIYGDIDYFKWFNDRYGFHRGDQLIQFTADCIQQVIGLLGHPYDFVGHIGGDDFIAITGSEDPEKLCEEMLRRFELGVKAFYDYDDWTYVEDRHGRRLESEGVTLSLSLVICHTGAGVSLEQISRTAAMVKKRSKAHRGSVVVCDCVGMPFTKNRAQENNSDN
ncbi:GGDEF domain-containing protein [Paenibacillus naphthalenovorans]|uniref:GGDEF domain-containing protein n=1 Tax=Paenibacillus naphthalenovorans TaxID=162209 RepID=UPI0009F25BBD|nr:GGDEF domain-containing protein [Paenibacillus naphthalenovorans]